MNHLIEFLKLAAALGTLVYGALALTSIVLLLCDSRPVVEVTAEDERPEERRAA